MSQWKIGTAEQIPGFADRRAIAVDLGFSTGATTGVAWREEKQASQAKARLLKFSAAVRHVGEFLQQGGCLIIEAPLSARFDASGNPMARGEFERMKRTAKPTEVRYWYSGPGASTCLAAHFFLRELYATLKPRGGITIFEGFISFKRKLDDDGKAKKSDHQRDALDLLEAFYRPDSANVYTIESLEDEKLLSLPKLLGLTKSSRAPTVIEPKKHRSV